MAPRLPRIANRRETVIRLVSLEDVASECREAVPGVAKEDLPAVVPASSDRSDDYSTRTGYQCPEIDALKTSGRPLDPVYAAFERSPYTSILKLSHSGLGVHPFASVEATGAFLSDWALAADWATVTSGGLAPDAALRSPKQLIYLAPSSRVAINSSALSINSPAAWDVLATRIRNLDPGSDQDILIMASALKTHAELIGGEPVAKLILNAFCSRSPKWDTTPEGYAADKYDRAEVWESASGETTAGPGVALDEHLVAEAMSDVIRYNMEQQRPEMVSTGLVPTPQDTEWVLGEGFKRTGVKLHRSVVGPMFNAVGLFNPIWPFKEYVEACAESYPMTDTAAKEWLHAEFFGPLWGYDMADPFTHWLATMWPGHLLENFFTPAGSRPTYSLLLHGPQRIGKDQSILQLVPPALSHYILEYQFGAAKEMAMASAGRIALLMPEMGLGDQRTISMSKFKMLVTNLPGYRGLYTSITGPAPTTFFFIFTVNPTELHMMEAAQMSSRLPAVEMRPQSPGPDVADFVAANRDRFWAAASATRAGPALLPSWMSDMAHDRFPSSPDTPLALVLSTMDVVAGRSYTVRELIVASPLGDQPIKQDVTRAVRAELEKQGWTPGRAGALRVPQDWTNPFA